MSKLRQEMNELLSTIVRSGKINVTTEQMKTVAMAIGNNGAIKFLDNASIKQQASLKKSIADKDTMFDQPAVNKANDDATVFGMSGSNKTLKKEEQKKIYTSEPVASTNETPDDKDMRARNKVEEHRPDTSDHIVDIATVSEALKPATRFPEILSRGEKDPVEKRSSKKNFVKKSVFERLGSDDLDIQAILRDEYPDAASMVSNVSSAVDYDVAGAMSFCLNLLEYVNAHSEMSAVRDVFEKALAKWGNTEASKKADYAPDTMIKDFFQFLSGKGIISGNDPNAENAVKEFVAQQTAAKKIAKDKEHIRGVPDGTGPHGIGNGPGKGRSDGTGFKQKPVEKQAIEVAPEETVTIKDDTGVEQTMMPAGSDPITGEIILVPDGTNVTKVSVKELINAKH